MDAAGYPESPMEQDDAVYQCKGCNEVLEEGKAFELAGHRWHIDCFRCNTCGTILDSDANLLLLGDGSLICNNCTYSCSVCGNKIEDLAILTGDQAFCATCFKCRNCKKKIENLKYARTSQGIFCMECHESLMQRRRKKNHKTANGSNRHKHLQQHHNNNMLLDKSLPSLPPSAVDRSAAFSAGNDSPPSETYSETPTELPLAQRKTPSNSRSRSDNGTPGSEIPRASQKRPTNARSHSSRSERHERSPLSPEDERKENLLLPSTTYNDKRQSAQSDTSGHGGDFITMVLDDEPASALSPMARRDIAQRDARSPQQTEIKPRDYFTTKTSIPRKPTREHDDAHSVPPQESPDDSRHSSQPNSPHIAYQERGRQLSADLTDNVRKKKDHGTNAVNSISATGHESSREMPGTEPRSHRNGEAQQNAKFMLQEVPKGKKSEKRNSKSDPAPVLDTAAIPGPQSNSAPVSASTQVTEQHVTIPPHESPISSRSDATLSGSPRDPHGSLSHTSTDSPTSHSSPLSTQLKTLPERGDSLARGAHGKHTGARKEIDGGGVSKLSTVISSSENGYEKPSSAPPTSTIQPSALANAIANASSSMSFFGTQDSPSIGNFSEAPPPPLRAKERLASHGGSLSDSFQSPRVPPHPPPSAQKPKNETVGALKHDPSRNGEQPTSPKLPRYAERGELALDEDEGRGMGQEGQADQGGFLRRVSHSVRHARSYSDRGSRLSKEQKWPKSPLIGSNSPSFAHEISSPTMASPETREEIMWFKNELRRERQRTIEKDQRLVELEAALEAKSSIKQMNTELREKRSTMVVLDTQKEIVVRELEVLTEHIATAKKSGEPLDVGRMSNAVLREFAESLQKLKDSFAPQIEDLTQRRDEMTAEVANVTQLKDKSFQEFEQLSVKNAQLADLNNQLVHQIQELYKANAGPAFDTVRPPPNGLGIYAQQQKDKPNALVENRDPRPSITDSNFTGSTVVHDQDVDPATYLSAPQVVNIRKAQPRKFNWKKGGQNVAKGVTKGLKGAFSSDGRGQRDGQYPEGMPYGAMSQQEYPSTSYTRNQTQDRREGFGGLFGNPKTRPQQWKHSPNNSVPGISSEGAPALFGSELEHRADYERVNIPGIVMRCIQEVDARGMDIEGIYRKSGGNSQIQTIKEGFERSNDYDISDPDLDINAVTSTLKQYLRKLPTPLITYEVYDKLLETASTDPRDIDTSHPAHPSNPNNHAYRVSSMRQAINELPPHHRDTLEVLVFHLARVIEHERDNLMTSLNVAVVFAPTVMRPESLAREMQDTQLKNAAVQFLIENCQGVFLGNGNSGERGSRDD